MSLECTKTLKGHGDFPKEKAIANRYSELSDPFLQIKNK